MTLEYRSCKTCRFPLEIKFFPSDDQVTNVDACVVGEGRHDGDPDNCPSYELETDTDKIAERLEVSCVNCAHHHDTHIVYGDNCEGDCLDCMKGHNRTFGATGCEDFSFGTGYYTEIYSVKPLLKTELDQMLKTHREKQKTMALGQNTNILNRLVALLKT